MVTTNLFGLLEHADGKSGEAAVSSIVGKKKTEAAAADLAARDKATRNKLQRDKGVIKCELEIERLRGILITLRAKEAKLEQGGKDDQLRVLLEEQSKLRQKQRELRLEQRELRQDEEILVPQRKSSYRDHRIPLKDGNKKHNNHSHCVIADSRSNYNDANGNVYNNSDDGSSGYSDYNYYYDENSEQYYTQRYEEKHRGGQYRPKVKAPSYDAGKEAAHKPEEKAASVDGTKAKQKPKEKMGSASEMEQKEANADVVPASEFACFSAPASPVATTLCSLAKENCPYHLEKKIASTDKLLVDCECEYECACTEVASKNTRYHTPENVAHNGNAIKLQNDTEIAEELEFHKIRLQEVLLEKEHLAQRLEFAEKQLSVVKSENDQLLEEHEKFQSLHDAYSSESGISKTVLKKLAFCHSVFLCSNEVGAKELQDYLSDPDLKLLCIINIPGALIDPAWHYDKLEKMTPLCKVVFLGMIDDVYRLHRQGLALGGHFSLSDFYWMLDQKVKFGGHVKKSVLKRNPKLMKLDYRRLYRLMLELLQDYEINIPSDLEYLLDLMRSSDPVKYQVLIRYNICLMDDISKRLYTLTLFAEWEKLNREDEVNCNGKKEEYRTFTVEKYITMRAGWSTAACSNKFVKKIHDAMTYTWKNKNYFVRFIRHCLVHLTDHAYDEYKKTHFDDTHVVDMVQVHCNCVFSQFQKGMHAIKRLVYPHLVRVMKV